MKHYIAIKKTCVLLIALFSCTFAYTKSFVFPMETSEFDLEIDVNTDVSTIKIKYMGTSRVLYSFKYNYFKIYNEQFSDGNCKYIFFADKPLPTSLKKVPLEGIHYCAFTEIPFSKGHTCWGKILDHENKDYEIAFKPKSVNNYNIKFQELYSELGNLTSGAFSSSSNNSKSAASEASSELPLVLNINGRTVRTIEDGAMYIQAGQTSNLGISGCMGDAVVVRTKTGKMIDETGFKDYTVETDADWLDCNHYKTKEAFIPLAKVNNTGQSRTAFVSVIAGGKRTTFLVTQRAY